jgi:HD superfamily phosphohydrolase
MPKDWHEIRDPIHTFIRLDTAERSVVDSRPFQRLRHIHQLALTYLVYPGATHRRFEHSLGVMELAGRVFDVVTDQRNIQADVQRLIPGKDALAYWRRVLRMAPCVTTSVTCRSRTRPRRSCFPRTGIMNG